MVQLPPFVPANFIASACGRCEKTGDRTLFLFRLLPSFRSFFLVFAAIALAGCGDPEQGSSHSPGKDASIIGERLLLEPPPGWLRGAERTTEKFRIANFYPAGNDQQNWYEKLTVESNNIAPLPDPIEFLDSLGDALKSQCKNSDHQPIATAEENGYQTSVRLLICGEDKTTRRVEVSLVKAIRGNDHFYTISHTKRSDPLANKQTPISKKEMAQWSLYMRSVKLCDSASAEHPCPQT